MTTRSTSAVSSLAQPIARAATAYATSGMPTGVSLGSSGANPVSG